MQGAAGALLTGAAMAWWATPAFAGTRDASTAPTPVVPGVSLEPSNCSGSGTVVSGSGQVLDHATAPGGGGASPGNPILVDPNGVVTYEGTSGTAITNHHWYVDLDGIEVQSGGSPNTGMETSTHGIKKISDFLPAHIITGTYYVDGAISGTGGECSGSAYVKIEGDPAATAAFGLVVVLFLLALWLFYAGMPDEAEEMLDVADELGQSQPPPAR